MPDPSAPFISYAQHGEDVILWRALRGRQHVFYVDVGAYDPTEDSVTRALYERGWRGVNIEPQPGRIDAFERDRPEDVNLAVAIGDHDGTATLAVPSNPGWSTIRDDGLEGLGDGELRRFEVPLRQLSTLLPELGVSRVDVVKIDVEGAEPAVVRGLLNGEILPAVVVLEGVAPTTGRTAGDEAVALLQKAGYTHCLFDGLNHYLTLDPSFVEALSIPANPVDGYILRGIAVLTAALEKTSARIAELEAENGRLSTAAARDSAPAQKKARLAAPPTAPVVSPRLRESRRRVAFARIIAGGPIEFRVDYADYIRDLRGAEPRRVVIALYRGILGRPPDPEGLGTWADRITRGADPVAIARLLFDSPEAWQAPTAKRLRARQFLDAVAAASTSRATTKRLRARQFLKRRQFSSILRAARRVRALARTAQDRRRTGSAHMKEQG